MRILSTATFLILLSTLGSIATADDKGDHVSDTNKVIPEFAVEWKANVNWKNIKGLPKINEAQSKLYIGKVVWITVAYKNEDEDEIVGYKHWAGTITTYSNAEGIQVDLFDSEGKAFLPPGPNVIWPAGPGKMVVRLNSGREVHNPDFEAAWICKPNTADKKHIEACPVHGLPFSSERVSAWHGRFSPHATKEWWERVAEAREKYPFAVPFPAQVEDPDIEVVVRSYCQDCRESFASYVSNEIGEQGGAGQPATAPDSKPEGSENPKPESEPASR